MAQQGLHFAITADNKDFLSKVAQSKAQVHGFVSDIEKSGTSIDVLFNQLQGKFRGLGIAIGAAFTLNAAKDFISDCINARSEVQSLEKSFTTLLQSEQKAAKMISEIRQFAASTPMDVSTLAKGAQTMMGFNIEAEKIMPLLRSIGDISMGDAQKFTSLSLAFSQMSATGKLMGQDLLQMINAGFNPLVQISEETGKSVGKLKEEMSEGKITVEDVTKAFISATSEGGKFHGMLQSQAQGMAGSFAYLRGAVADAMNDIGASLNDATVSGVNMAAELVKNYKTLGDVLIGLVATYGAYKAAVMVEAATAIATETVAAQATLAAYNNEAEALMALLPAKKEEAATSLEIAVANGRLTESQAAVILSLREEAATHVKLLQEKAATAALSYETAMTELRSAEIRQAAASQSVTAAEAQYVAALKSGNQAQITAARIALETATEEANTAAKKVNTAASNLNTASKEKEVTASVANKAAKDLETTSTIGNTGAETANAAATNLLTVAKQKLTVCVQRLYAAISAHPYAIAAAAVIALGYGIYKLVTYQTEAEKAQNKLNEAFSNAQSEIQAESSNIEILFGRLKNAKKETEEYQKVKDLIISQYGKYLTGLINEKNELIDLEAAYHRVSAAAREAANSRALANYTDEAQKKYEESHSDVLNDIQKKLDDRIKNDNKRSTLLQLVIKDMEQIGRLSVETEDALGKAFGEKRLKNGNWSAASDVVEIKKLVKEERDALNLRNNSIQKANEKFGQLQNEYSELSATELKKRRDALKESYEDVQSNGGKFIDVLVDGEIKETFKSLEDAQLALYKLDEAYKAKVAEESSKQSSNLANKISESRKEWEDAKNELKKIKANPSDYSSEDYEKAVQREETAKKAYKAYGGDVSSESKKKASERRKEEQRLADEVIDLQLQNQQDEINLLKESGEKAVRQINLNYEKRKVAIERQERDMREANKESTGKSGLTDEQAKQLETARKLNETERDKLLDEQRKAELASMLTYLQEYGSFQQQKLAIAEEYAKKIREANDKGDQWEARRLEKERDAKIGRIDTQAIEQKIDWQTAFGSLTGVLRDDIKNTLDALSDYTKTDKFASSSAEDKAIIYDAIERLKNELPGGDGTINIKSLSAQFEQLGKKIEETQALYDENEQAQESLVLAQQNYQTAMAGGSLVQQKMAAEILKSAEESAQRTKTAYEQAATDVENFGRGLTNKAQDTVKGIDKVSKGLEGLASGSLKGAWDGLNSTVEGLKSLNIGGKVGDAVDKLSESLSSNGVVGGIIGAILGLLDVLKDGFGSLISGLLDTIFDAVIGILDDILKGKFAVKIGESLMKGVGGILNTVTFGGFNSWFGTKGNTREVNETTERLTKANERLRESIDKLKDEISDDKGGWKAIRSANDAINAQESINKNALEILMAQMGYHGAHHSNAYYWNLSGQDYRSINETLAQYAAVYSKEKKSVGSLTDLYTLTPEEMDYIRTHNIEMWEQIISQGKYDKSEYWEAYADEAGKLEEITEQLKETLTQTSFDSFRDSFVSSLLDMKKKSKDFADDFKQYLMKSVLNSRISDLLDAELRKFYDKWAEYAKSDNDLSTEEQRMLQDEYNRIVEQGLALRNQIATITGYDKSSYSQEASRGYSTELSEETGSEINGRLTGIQEALYTILDYYGQNNGEIITIRTLATERNEILDSIQNNIGIVTTYLASIAKNTAQLNAVRSILANIENLVKSI